MGEKHFHVQLFPMPETIPALTIAASAFSASFVVNLLLSSKNLRHLASDLPGHRSLHLHATPRTGGLGIIIGLLFASLSWLHWPLPWILAVGLLAAVSMADDFISLPAHARLLAHIVCSSLSLYELIPPTHFWLLLPPLVLVTVWSTNLYNFMDGANGLAGGMGMIGFSWLALASWHSAPDLAGICLALASASAGFWCINFWSGRIFMGDAGSTLLGMCAALIGISGTLRQCWPFWLPLMVFSPFIADASVTLAKRVCAKQRFWEAHREHYYQRLIRSGWSHRQLALASYTLMLFCGGLAMQTINQSNTIIISIWFALLLIYQIMFHLIDSRWKHFADSH